MRFYTVNIYTNNLFNSSRWQKCDSNKFGNDVYSVEFECDKTKPPLFGAKYNFHLEGVVHCPEFLVYLPVLRKLALKYGLELIEFERYVRETHVFLGIY